MLVISCFQSTKKKKTLDDMLSVAQSCATDFCNFSIIIHGYTLLFCVCDHLGYQALHF